jgi:hypothetical protein
MDGLNSGSSTHSFLSVVSINTDDIRQHIFGTSGSGLTASDVGVIVGVGTASGSRAVNLTVKNANVSSSGAICTGIAPNAWAVVGAGFNGAGTANSLRNNDTGTFSAASSYYTASPAAAPFGIGCRTPNDQPFSSGAKMAMFAMWSVTLTQTQLRSLFARIHTRFGL